MSLRITHKTEVEENPFSEKQERPPSRKSVQFKTNKVAQETRRRSNSIVGDYPNNRRSLTEEEKEEEFKHLKRAMSSKTMATETNPIITSEKEKKSSFLPPLFKKATTVPPLNLQSSRKQWEQTLFCELDKFIQKQDSFNPEVIVERFIREKGVETTQIPKNFEEIKKSLKKSQLIDSFLQIKDPSLFLEKYSKLGKKQQGILSLVIGKEQIDILNLFSDPAVKVNWIQHVKNKMGPLLEQKVIDALKKYTLKLINEGWLDPQFIVDSFIKTQGVKMIINPFCIQEKSEEPSFFSKFQKINDPELFLKEYKSLKENEAKQLLVAIGGEITIDLLSLFHQKNHKLTNETVKPLIDQELEQRFYTALEAYTKIQIENREMNVRTILEKFIKYKAIETLNVIKRLQSFIQSSSTSIINKFLKIKDPKKFIDEYEKLEKKQKALVLNAMGGKEMKIRLTQLNDKKRQEIWSEFVEKYIDVQKAIAQIDCKKHSFPFGFDEKYPISQITSDHIPEDVFRFFVAPDFKESNPIFLINGVHHPLPKSTEDKKANKHNLTKWLIQTLNKTLNSKGQLSLDEQTKLAYQCPPLKNKEVMSETLQSLFDQEGRKKESLLKAMIYGKVFSESFKKWTKNNFEKYFSDENNKPRQIIEKYETYKWVKKCRKEIPCFYLLQPLTFGAYYPAVYALKESFCPALFQKIYDAPFLKKQSLKPTRYRIDTDPVNKTFKVTQIRPYCFCSENRGNPQDFGEVDINWQIRGNLGSKIYTAQLWASDLKFYPETDGKTKIMLLEKFGVIPWPY